MPWGQFFTIIAQVLIGVLFGLVMSAVIVAVVRGVRGDKS
jgi:hypothetical protein